MYEMIVTYKDKSKKPERFVFTTKALLNNALKNGNFAGVSYREVKK